MPVYQFPDCVTHNYDPAHGPFQNLCALPRDEAARILTAIGMAGCRVVKPTYLGRRLGTERWLRAECTRRFGPPRLPHPIYFFLGNFADGRDPGRPASHVMPLAQLPADAITFTVGDSMTSYAYATNPAHAKERRPHHGRLFTLAEIRTHVASHGLPEPGSFIELQLWDDSALAGMWLQTP